MGIPIYVQLHRTVSLKLKFSSIPVCILSHYVIERDVVTLTGQMKNTVNNEHAE